MEHHTKIWQNVLLGHNDELNLTCFTLKVYIVYVVYCKLV